MSAVTDDISRDRETRLLRRIAKLERINAALMAHVERATDQHGGAYSLFQTAITLEGRVRGRTEELTALMHSLERSNEALKAAKEEAETANRSKTKFLAAASHDLLQPLNAARLSSSTLVGMPLSDEARGIAGQVERALQTIEDVIKTLLDISKLDAGVVRPVMKAVRLRTVMAGIEQSFRPLAETKSIRLIIRCPDLAVESDALLLQRVIQNLVSNAIRYTKRGGVMVAARARAGRCAIDVIDTGSGIPEAERNLVFEEFYRGRQAFVAEAGLGLGLSIVRRLVQALDHELGYWSRVGHGSRFSVTLPFASGLVEEDATPAADAFSPAGASVLIVENDVATKTALSRLLQSWSLQVTAISDIAEWRGWGSTRAPDLLIVDYHLDDGAIGLDVIDEIRAATHPGLPVIVVTADHSEAVEAVVLEARCALIHKPVKPAQLRSLLSFLILSGKDGRS